MVVAKDIWGERGASFCKRRRSGGRSILRGYSQLISNSIIVVNQAHLRVRVMRSYRAGCPCATPLHQHLAAHQLVLFGSGRGRRLTEGSCWCWCGRRSCRCWCGRRGLFHLLRWNRSGRGGLSRGGTTRLSRGGTTGPSRGGYQWVKTSMGTRRHVG